MSRFDELGGRLQTLAVLAAWALLFAFGLFLLLAPRGGESMGGEAFAWISAGLVLALLLGHLKTRVHARADGLGRHEKAGLTFELHRERGPFRWRERRVRPGRGGFAGRSHSGERPRYD